MFFKIGDKAVVLAEANPRGLKVLQSRGIESLIGMKVEILDIYDYGPYPKPYPFKVHIEEINEGWYCTEYELKLIERK